MGVNKWLQLLLKNNAISYKTMFSLCIPTMDRFDKFLSRYLPKYLANEYINEIIITDENGNGFYWADLNTKNSSEECNRMGHCGRSSYGSLFSLRQNIPLNNKYKLNKSVLTAAIGEDSILYQLKGVKNSKPKDEYHQYILPKY